MENYIEITKVVKERVPLLRDVSLYELKKIKNDEMFDIYGLIDWDNAEVIKEDYSYGGIRVVEHGKTVYNRKGKHFKLFKTKTQ